MNPSDLLHYLNSGDDHGLYAQADAIRRKTVGSTTSSPAVIRISNICDRECRHCNLRSANLQLPRYRLHASHALALVAKAVKDKADAVVLESGHDQGWTPRLIGEMIREIKARHDVSVTLSLGQRSLDEFAYWKECGADRCLLNLETSEPFAFKRLRPGNGFTDRLHLLEELRRLGYGIGTGVMAGLPGATPMDSLRDILFLSDLAPDMIGIAPFVPRPDTPMGGMGPGSVDTAMRMAALLRILLPTACIPAMNALDELRPGSCLRALECGCNALPSHLPHDSEGMNLRPNGQAFTRKSFVQARLNAEAHHVG